jgi:hypothetical protein
VQISESGPWASRRSELVQRDVRVLRLRREGLTEMTIVSRVGLGLRRVKALVAVERMSRGGHSEDEIAAHADLSPHRVRALVREIRRIFPPGEAA